MTDAKGNRSNPGWRPNPEQMSPRYTQPGRKWIPLHGPYKGELGAEYCATSDFEWLGLSFTGERGYHIFNLDDLQPAD
jgi:hypothetical protein